MAHCCQFWFPLFRKIWSGGFVCVCLNCIIFVVISVWMGWGGVAEFLLFVHLTLVVFNILDDKTWKLSCEGCVVCIKINEWTLQSFGRPSAFLAAFLLLLLWRCHWTTVWIKGYCLLRDGLFWCLGFVCVYRIKMVEGQGCHVLGLCMVNLDSGIICTNRCNEFSVHFWFSVLHDSIDFCTHSYMSVLFFFF